MPEALPITQPHSQDAAFLDLLRDALADIGIPSERDFCIPGGNHRIDLFLPRLPRAAVEFKSSNASRSLVRDSILQADRLHQELQGELGSSFMTILLLVRPTEQALDPTPELPDGICCLFVEPSPILEEVAKAAAVQIQKALDAKRALVLGLSLGTASVGLTVLGTVGLGGTTVGVTMGAAAASAAISFLSPLALLAGGAWALKRFRSFTAHKPKTSDNSAAHGVVEPIPTPEAVATKAITPPPSGEVVRAIAAQAVNIMETFRELVPESYAGLAHEMEFLVEEFRQGHYTACVLRAGRSLEFMVYELSRHWGIEIQDATSGMLQDLRSHLDHVGDLLGDYQFSVGDRKGRVELDLNASLTALSTKTMALALVIKDQQPLKEPKNDLGPRTVATLLKKICKRYGKLEGVARDLGALIEKGADTPAGSLVGRVLRTRNRAAHADVNGQQQEADESSVKGVLDDINVVMLKLSNVGIAIRKSQAGT